MFNQTFLMDEKFLQELYNCKIKTSYVKIHLLNYNEDIILKSIEGTITDGNINVNGASPIRRTLSLTMLANDNNQNLLNLSNDISLNKKIYVEIGCKNILQEYKKYGDIIWFPQGVYLITQASISKSNTSYTISVQGKDKMVNLDGTVGGVLPAITTFHEMEEDGNIIQNSIFSIIQTAVHQYGHQPLDKILIHDIDFTARTLLKYMGDEDIYFNGDYSDFTFSSDRQENSDYNFQVINGQNIGYEKTDFTYPGELILNAGDTITSLLTKINETLGGNYEFFYDLYGNFVFQEKKNYLNTQIDLKSLTPENYTGVNNRKKYKYSFFNYDNIISINQNPKYENIKNDYIVWGERKTESGGIVPIRYHTIINAKPQYELINQYMYAKYSIDDIYYEQCKGYAFEDEARDNLETFSIGLNDNLYKEGYQDTTNQTKFILIGKPPSEENKDWREELYRQVLIGNNIFLKQGGYDLELLTEWRKIYDTIAYENCWNPNVISNPETLDYWLDFLDDPRLLQYSVDNIGLRSKIINDKNVNCLYKLMPHEEIYFITHNLESTPADQVNEYQNEGKRYVFLTPETRTLFSLGTGGYSAFEKIRNLLSTHLLYNISSSITCFPIYHLEPNQLLNLQLDNLMVGKYLINSFTIPLSYNGTMTIQISEIPYQL